MCGDKTSWGQKGWDEASSGLMFKILNRTGVRKGGHIVMVNDVYHVLPREYMHWDKMHNHPDNFKSQGYDEVCIIIGKLEDMIVEYPTMVGVNNIYDNIPEICWEN